ncbi:hypothetical protein ACV311_14910 [Clostridium perfringens]|uniref:Uncharacterized protein n=1 Tax=Clostridium perfringens TaxID=1502 RepID=A0AAE8FRX4_CLOPF|nr:hypothetical protein [Clostridium perfringens]MDK3000684.1 hypothetical protein [Clostridium perfringens]RQN22841.1 hypothetical protein EHZ11_15105 [Clostridium perfringens]
MNLTDAKKEAYDKIETNADSVLFNTISMNEENLKKIYNLIPWYNVINDKPDDSAVVLYLYILKDVVVQQESYEVIRNISWFESGEISVNQAIGFIVRKCTDLGVSASFIIKSGIYLKAICNTL